MYGKIIQKKNNYYLDYSKRVCNVVLSNQKFPIMSKINIAIVILASVLFLLGIATHKIQQLRKKRRKIFINYVNWYEPMGKN